MAIMTSARSKDTPIGIRAIEACGSHGSPEARLRRYQILVLVLTFLTYMCYHMTRKPTSVVKSVLNPKVTDGNYASGWWPFNKGTADSDGVRHDGKATLGLLDTAFLFAYAFGMFFSGTVADRSNLRTYLSFSMTGAAVMTTMFGMGYFWKIHELWYFMFVQVVAGIYQATGWPATVAVVGKWFPHGKRGLVMGIWNSHTSVGNILGALIPGALLTYGWGYAFVVPAGIMLFVALLVYLFLPVYPSDLDLPDPLAKSDEEEASEHAPLVSANHEEHEAVPFLRALFIPGVLAFSFSLFFCKLVAYTFLFWLPYYIKHQEIGGHILTSSQSAYLSTLFDVGGIAGGILAGYLADRTRRPALINVIFLYVAVPVLYIYHEYSHGSYGENVGLLLLTGAIVNGPYALITTAVSADLGTHPSLMGNPKALATVTAIIDGTGSIGAAIGPYLAGSIKGWNNVFWMLMASSGIAALLLTGQVIKEFRRPKQAIYSALN
eukprot:TRINITY_DN11906_c0_g3_i2.p1 TRINITY_DN11906_c0_g3~~TRINITY_DN11906_c0_g3_i2.p1  ORF type:complete len:492 (+),score=79.06 TRINITY_DN11906_c0_g3_i2:122-1597(+)